MSTVSDRIRACQQAIEFDDTGKPLVIDGEWGPKTEAAKVMMLTCYNAGAPWPPQSAPAPAGAQGGAVHAVKASSFADPADYRAWERCKAEGKSDQECFEVGDNCIGKWGDSTKEGTGPSCALPPEDWEPLGSSAHLAKILVTGNGRSVVCELKDTMPHRANITNGCGLDLNPDAVAALGWRPPLMEHVTWQFLQPS